MGTMPHMRRGKLMEDETYEIACKIARLVKANGGRALIVGGWVRDFLLGVPSNDIDLEVFGLTEYQVRTIIARNYQFNEVGQAFGVLKVKVPNSDEVIDVSLPRKEVKTGDGHRGFSVEIDPYMSFFDASRRRDLTINSMGYDPLEGTIIDPHGGKNDIEYGWIKHTSDAFYEDPLRVLRVARFAAKYDFYVTLATMQACQNMENMADYLPSERLWMEMEKTMLQTNWPSRFFRELNYYKWLRIFPEVKALIGVEQDCEWHPEGDVFEHTMHAIDYWAQNLRTGNRDDDLVVGLGVLCHDFGKVSTTGLSDGRIRALGHEEAGVEPTKNFLHRLGQYELAKKITPLVANHLYPNHSSPFTAKGIRRLSTKVDRLDLLATLSRADVAGRPPKDPAPSFYKISQFEEVVRTTDVPVGGPKPFIGGDDLIEIGMKPGPEFKTILDRIYESQLDGEVEDINQAHELLSKILVERYETALKESNYFPIDQVK